MDRILNVVLLIWLSLAWCPAVDAQRRCGFDSFHAQRLVADPQFRSRLASFERVWQEHNMGNPGTANRVLIDGTDTVYEIPVVFHIIHTGSAIGTPFNPTDAHIDSVVDYLNGSFAATWPGYPTSATGGTDVPLRFVLAKRDPQCSPTTGINRVNGVTALGGSAGAAYENYGVNLDSLGGISEGQLKSLVQWDPYRYYNIWVVNKIDGWDGVASGGGVLGYAAFPDGNPAEDGTVILEQRNYAGEETLPHELGHAFHLYHTFEDGCVPVSGCAANGDRVCDTDPHDQVYGSPTGNNPCTGTPWFPVSRNFMNYTDSLNRFTAGQAERVKATIFNSQSRGMLVQSLGGTAPGVEGTYALPIPLLGCATAGIINPANTNDMGPRYVAIADLQSFTGGYNADGNMVYIDHTEPTCLQAAVGPAHMEPGQAYPVSIGTGYNPENVRVYIDFDNNGAFDPAIETVFTSDGTSGDSYRIHMGNTISIPSSGVTIGIPLRMRVLADYWGNSSPTPCGSNLLYGQMEDFTVIIGNSPLPVAIRNLSAQPMPGNRSVNILWESELEGNTETYTVQRSVDGVSFTDAGSIPAKGSYAHYSFNDPSPEAYLRNFYRLKIVDKDLSFAYSRVVSATILAMANTELNIYPSPGHSIFYIDVPKTGTFDLTISNGLGEVIYKSRHVEIRQNVPFKQLLEDARFPAGMYYIRLIAKTGLSYSGKFVKQ